MTISDDDVEVLLQHKAEQFAAGDLPRDQLQHDLVNLLAQMEGVLSRHGSLQAQGRVSFGRKNQGKFGTALFLPDEDHELSGDGYS